MTTINRVLIQANRRLALVRRLDATGRIDLSKRRTWHDETPPPPPPATPPPPAGGQQPPAAPPAPTPPAEPIPDWVSDPEKAYAEILKVRGEAAKARTDKHAAETALQTKLTAEQQAEQQRLIDEKKYQDLYEQEKAKREASEAQVRTAQLDALRITVGAAAGLPVELAARLVGTTEEELKADADKLKALLPLPPGQTPAPGAPRQTTTPIPGGAPAGETDDQRRNRLRGGGAASVFAGGQVVDVQRKN